MKLTLLALLLSLTAASVAAQPDCFCVANGERVPEGDTACIHPSSTTAFLARCERVLNNTSWTKIRNGCPEARNRSPVAKPAAL